MILTLLIALSIALVAALVVKPSLAVSRGGRAFAFFALLLLPSAAALLGVERHVETSKRTEFCVSCHAMELHGKSLRVDDDSLLVAAHFQGGRIPRETACFACHTTYTMYGDFAAKLRGLRHVWVNYVKGPPPEKEIKLYAPYNNRECLYCHEGARRFEEGKVHRLEPGRIERIRKNELSCIAKGCHDVIHEVGGLDGLSEWHPPADGKQGGKP